jgi:Cu/Ag efflux pump CusA
MAIGLGGKSPIWMPIAYTIIFGLFAATLLTLFVMPALYAITADVREVFIKRERVEPVFEDLPLVAERADD